MDWIKVQKETPDKPEIAILARLLKVSHSEAFLQWFRAYAWADGITSGGDVPFLSLSEGDTLSHCKRGTFAALASKEIGWIEDFEGGLRFKNWDRHNGKSAKQRAQDTEKKRIKRNSMSQKCPDAKGTKSGPEKRREEYKEINKESFTDTLPENYDLPEVRAAFSKWFAYLDSKGKSVLNPHQAAICSLGFFKGPAHLIANINFAISNQCLTLKDYPDAVAPKQEKELKRL